MGSNIAAILQASGERHAARPALRLGDAVTTYEALEEASALAAGLLRGHGIDPGDRVAIMLPNLPEFAFAYYGTLRLGAIAVPMNVLLKRREIAFLLRDSGARVIFAFEGLHEHAVAAAEEVGARCVTVAFDAFDTLVEGAEPVRDVARSEGGDTAVVIYTSGTTGTPKGAELTHDNLRRNFEISVGLFNIGPGDVALGSLPLFHSFGQTCGLNAALSAGACLTLLPRFEAGQALAMLDGHAVTIAEGVPTMYAAMVAHPDAPGIDTSRLRVCISGGSAMPIGVLQACEETFGCDLREGYGLTETSPVASFNQPGSERKPGSIGTPIEGVEMRVVDGDDNDLPIGEVGEILIRGHNVMRGYWRQPEATAETLRGGWMHTGDLARVDDDGYFFIVDRKKDMILRGGLNVYSREVEAVLEEHPAVLEAAILPVPHALLGEEVGAAVVLREGAVASSRELRSFVRSEIASYKHPRHLWFVDELPKGPTGKVLKRAIGVPAEIAAG